MHPPQRLSESFCKPSMVRSRWLVLAAVLMVSACQMRGNDRPVSSEAPPPPVFVNLNAPAAIPVTCRAAKVRFALGDIINSPLLEEIRVQAGARYARTVLTSDKEPFDVNVDEGRLSVDVEPSGRVVGARCG